MIDLKRIAAGTMIVGAFGLAVAGMGTGVANAAPGAPNIDIVEKPHHDDWDDWDDWRGWDGPRYWGPSPSMYQRHRSVRVRHRHRVHLATA